MKKIQSKVKVFIKRGLFLAAFFCFLFATATLFPISSSEQRAEAVDVDPSNPSITLSVDNTAASATIKPENTSPNESSGIYFSVSTSNYSGYKVLLSASNDDGALSTKDGHKINSVSSWVQQSEFAAAKNTQYDNTWGYRTINPPNFSPIMPSPTTTADTLFQTSAANSTANDYILYFVVRINQEAPTGTYTKDLTLSAIVNPIPEDKIMQNYTYERCQAEAADGNVTLADIRDGKSYTVRFINGNCWMTQNLNYTFERPLQPETTNVASTVYLSNGNQKKEDYNSAYYYTLTDNERGASLTAAEEGALYNFCAASAGEICDAYNHTESTQDICPAGWRLPTQNEQSTLINFASAFSPVYSGAYASGSLRNIGTSGYWWSSTSYSTSAPMTRSALSYNGSSLSSNTGGGMMGQYQLAVRCIKKKV